MNCHPERSRGICGAPLGLSKFWSALENVLQVKLQFSRSTANAGDLAERRALSRIIRVAQGSQIKDVRRIYTEFQKLFVIDRKRLRDRAVITLITRGALGTNGRVAISSILRACVSA